jgi:hypothetical protein
MLAKYGLVEDAGGGTGRRRPWRRASPAGFSFPAVSDDAQAGLAADALSSAVSGRYLDRARVALARKVMSLFGDSALWLALAIWIKVLTGSSSAAGLA